MREVEYEGFEFKVRALKRKEVRELKDNGFNLENLDRERADECLDLVFALVFDGKELDHIDELEYHNALKLWRDVLKETYGARDEEKN